MVAFSKPLKTVSFVLMATAGAEAAGLGKWGPTIQFPTVPVAAAILHETGDLFVWSAYAKDRFQVAKAGYTQSAVWTPSTGAISQYNITQTNHDMFCPGISRMADGKIIVTGGDTAAKTSIHDGGPNDWVSTSDMTQGRGYQASATCSDGRVFTIGGSWSGARPAGGKAGEIYDPTTKKWNALPGALVGPMLTADKDGIFRQDSHGWLFGWKNGYVFQAGPSSKMNWYGTSGTGAQKAAGTRAADPDAMNGNAVMIDAVKGQILTLGGAPDYQNANATTAAHIITINNPNVNPTVTKINNMYYPRSFANSVVLPDGDVFIVGGQAYAVPFTDTTAQLTPELWDSTTLKFTKMAVGPTPRTYHSVALLMPDATIFSGGGGLCGTCTTNHFDGQIYSPPYLFAADGVTPVSRPSIVSVSANSVALGGSLAVRTAHSVVSFSLIRMGSATHSIDTDQRRIPLLPTSTNKQTYTLTIPSDPGVALPGYWYLFANDNVGTPSIASIIQIAL